MSEKERITQPTMGSNKPGAETNEVLGKGETAGTDTQLRLAAMSTQKKSKDENDKKEKKKQDKKGGKDLPTRGKIGK